jgi:adenylosuccinate synthase
MTKTDILDTLPELNVCTSYKINGEEKNYVPFQMTQVKIDPVFKSFEGWQTDITAMSEYDSLPQNMKNYIDYINKFLKVPVKFISNGPGRDQIILA